MIRWLLGGSISGEELRERLLQAHATQRGSGLDSTRVLELQDQVRQYVCSKAPSLAGKDCFQALVDVVIPAPAGPGQEAFLRQICGLDRFETPNIVRKRRVPGMSLQEIGRAARETAQVAEREFFTRCLYTKNATYATIAREAATFAYGSNSVEMVALKRKIASALSDSNEPAEEETHSALDPLPVGDSRTALNGMIGLDGVKRQIGEFTAILQVDKAEGHASAQGLNMLFAGNPGTGKTTVARLYGGILRDLGILPRGHVVEVTRSTLVAGYIGQTAIKTREAIVAAEGGVLFVDEAHALAGSSKNDFGYEAVREIMLAMENRRGKLAIVFATYSAEVAKLYELDPGFKRRVAKVIEFDDYTDAQLQEILVKMAQARDLTFPPKVAARVAAHVGMGRGLPDFGNAGTLRNAFEQGVARRAVRLTAGRSEGSDASYLPTGKPLPPLIAADFGIAG